MNTHPNASSGRGVRGHLVWFLAVGLMMPGCQCSPVSSPSGPFDAVAVDASVPATDAGQRDLEPRDAGTRSCAASCGREFIEPNVVLCGSCSTNETCVLDGGSGTCRALPFGPACSLEGICADSPLAPVADFSAIWGSGAADVWAVGDFGRIWHFDGLGWSASRALSTAHLNDVHGTSATDVWVVGDRGQVARFDGTQWRELPGPAITSLTAVFVAGPDSVFVASEDGRLFLWNGRHWRLDQLSPTAGFPASLAGRDDEVWWADGSVIRRRTATGWSDDLLPGNALVTSLASGGPGELLASTVAGVLRFDGQHWTTESTPCPGSGRVAAAADTTWYVSLDCSSKSAVTGAWSSSAHIMRLLTDVWLESPTEGWVVGHGGFLARINGDEVRPWSDLPPFLFGHIDGTSRDDLWAIDRSFAGGLWRRISGQWSRVQLPENVDAGVTALEVVSRDDVWIAAGAQALHFDGRRWQTTAPLRFPSIRVLSAGDQLWAHGAVGAKSAQRFDGTAWFEVPLGSGDGGLVHRVVATATGDVFAVSNGHQVWHLDDGGFVLDAELIDDDGRFYAVSGLGGSAADLWLTSDGRVDAAGGFIGRGSVLRRTDGGLFEALALPGGDSAQVLGLTVSTPDDIWFYGQHLSHWDGARMTQTPREEGLHRGFISSAVAVDGGLVFIGTFSGVRVLRTP